ncbi:MAG: Rdx family protein [Actinomycetia bacterium]|nr:Rdx family protein [Actinomycetes bacterium]
MVQAILGKYEHYIDDITIIPSRGGAFEVVVGDSLVYSKLETGRHATIDEVMESVDAILGPVPDPESS